MKMPKKKLGVFAHTLNKLCFFFKIIKITWLFSFPNSVAESCFNAFFSKHLESRLFLHVNQNKGGIIFYIFYLLELKMPTILRLLNRLIVFLICHVCHLITYMNTNSTSLCARHKCMESHVETFMVPLTLLLRWPVSTCLGIKLQHQKSTNISFSVIFEAKVSCVLNRNFEKISAQ